VTTGNNAGKRVPSIPPVSLVPPTPPTTTIHVVQLTMPSIRALCTLAALVAPGVLIGAAVAYTIWRHMRPQRSSRWASAIGAAVLGGLFIPVIVWLWPVRLLFGLLPPDGNVGVSVIGEALWGPLVLQALLHVTVLDRNPARTAGPHQGAPGSHGTPTSRASSPPSPSSSAPPASPWAHPPGAIRLGVDASGVPFDLSLDKLDELAQHVFIPGLAGTGKTTTLTRLMDGALANRYGVVVVDCKGGGLHTAAKSVAEAHGLGTYIVSPSDPGSLGYNPCTGPGYSVANKIVGAFSFGGEAAIYRDIALGIVPPIVDAMRAAGEAVTLDSLWAALSQPGLTELSTRVGKVTRDQALVDSLKALADEKGTSATGRDGLRSRLLAFRNGAFGALLRKEPALMWGDALAHPSVVYVELPALGADQDVGLLGRVVLQDLKEVAKARLEARKRGETVAPILVVIDEFAALREAEQINDLLLQGREAQMRIVVASQFLPKDETLRKLVVGANLLLVHRVQADDADVLAKQVGTRATMETSFTMDDNRDPQSQSEAPHQSTNTRLTEEFNAKPQTLANLPVGQVAVRSVVRSTSGWCGVVSVYKEISGS